MADRKATIPGGVIVFHDKGFRDVLTSGAVRDLIEDKAKSMVVEAMTVGNPAITKQYSYSMGETDRARAIVYTASGHAIRSNQKHNTLIKVMKRVKF